MSPSRQEGMRKTNWHSAVGVKGELQARRMVKSVQAAETSICDHQHITSRTFSKPCDQLATSTKGAITTEVQQQTREGKVGDRYVHIHLTAWD
jgi:hypothetical protein